MAILLEGELLDKNDQERQESHNDFKQEDILKEFESYFTAENKQSYDDVHESTNSTE